MRKFLFLINLTFPIVLISQKKIDHKIYMYGNVSSKIKGATLIKFNEADPETDLKTVKYFNDKGGNAISWNSLFLPGADYTIDEFNKILNENKIETIIMIGLIGITTSNYSYSNTNAYVSAYPTKDGIGVSGSSQTTGGNINYTYGVSLKMDVFSIENNFDKPQGVIIGEATGDWGVASSERSIAKKILRRILKGLEKENAFKVSD